MSNYTYNEIKIGGLYKTKYYSHPIWKTKSINDDNEQIGKIEPGNIFLFIENVGDTDYYIYKILNENVVGYIVESYNLMNKCFTDLIQ